MTDANPLDAALWDDSIPVADDFYRHVNGGWLDANPVPPEYPMWGAYIELDHRNKELTRRLLEEAAAAGPDGDFVTRLVGRLLRVRHGRGRRSRPPAIEPLRPYLDRIDAARVRRGRARAQPGPPPRRRRRPASGSASRRTSRTPRPTSSTSARAGSACPERDYYLRDDERSVALRGAYVAHVATQLGNLGRATSEAAATAERSSPSRRASPRRPSPPSRRATRSSR